jgi:hypothetical protein
MISFPMFSSVTVLVVTFKSLVHFELIFLFFLVV